MSLLMRRFKIGRGTGHLDVEPDAIRSSSACFSAAAASRKLLLSASSEGQHLARMILRTARLDALFKAWVKDMEFSLEIELPLLLLLRSYARDKETSAGAMQ